MADLRNTRMNILEKNKLQAPEKHFSQNWELHAIFRLDDLRFQRAKLLLADSNLSIGQIARNLGYVHQMHFSRRFRERFNMSPSKFRKIQSVIPQKEN